MPVSVLQAPLPKFQFNQDGAPLAGGKVFTYASGTTTKLATYKDFTGTTPNTNPIILDVNGQCDIWLIEGDTYTFVLSPSTDTDPPANAFWTENGITGIANSVTSGAGGTGGIVLQTGDVKWFAAADGNLAEGWLLCTGAPISRTDFATLYNAIGTTWGIGDGTTTFNLPDLRGRVPAGADNMGSVAANRITSASIGANAPAVLGATGGTQLAQADTLTTFDPGHTHAVLPAGVVGLVGSGTFAPTSEEINAETGITISTNVTGVTVFSNLTGDQQNVQPTIFGNFAIWSGPNLTNSSTGGTVLSVAAGAGLAVGAGPGGTITTDGTLNVIPATTTTLGGVIIGSNITVNAGGTISVIPGAGGVTAVVAGTGLEVGSTPGGTISASGTLNILPATTAALGGIVAGANTTINTGGTLSVAAGAGGVSSIGGQSGSIAVGAGVSVSGGTLVNTGILSLVEGTGILVGGGNTIDNIGVLSLGTVTGAIPLGGGISFNGGGSLINSGVLAVGAAAGSIVLGPNLALTGQTLNVTGVGSGTVTALTAGTAITLTPTTITSTGTINNTGVTAVGAASGAIVLGTNLSLTGQTLNATGGAAVPAAGVVSSNGTSLEATTLQGASWSNATLVVTGISNAYLLAVASRNAGFSIGGIGS